MAKSGRRVERSRLLPGVKVDSQSVATHVNFEEYALDLFPPLLFLPLDVNHGSRLL
jgi:hypothetical protein